MQPEPGVPSPEVIQSVTPAKRPSPQMFGEKPIGQGQWKSGNIGAMPPHHAWPIAVSRELAVSRSSSEAYAATAMT